jgi:RNase P subunit RPR2
VLSRYLNFIDCSKKNYENKQYSSEAQKLFKIIMLDNKIIITNEIFNVIQVLKLIDSEFNEFLSKEIKSSICVTCEQNFNDSYREISSAKNQSQRQNYILPCKCSFCSLPCLKKHLELFFQANYKLKELYCLCGINYDNNMLKDLFSYCCMDDLKKFKEKIVDIFKNKIKSQCMICLLEINKKGKFEDEDTIITIQLRDDNVETIFNLKKFKHFICLNCLKQLYPSFNLDKTSNEKVPFDQLCMICNSIHRINKFIAKKSTSQSNNECNII